jgi:YD repeat-containing protein
VTYSSYDGNGNLLTKTDARNVVTSFSYDLLNRITLKSYAVAGSVAPTDSVTYCYDGQVAGASDGECTTPTSAIAYGWNHLTEFRTAPSTTTYGSYDALGRVTGSTQTTASTPYTFAYEYNLAGGLTKLTYPSNRVVQYDYTSGGRVSGVRNVGGGSYASGISYAPHGGARQITLGNSLIEQTCYNGRLQPVAIRQRTGLAADCTNPAWDSNDLLYLSNQYYQGSSTQNDGNVWQQASRYGSAVFQQTYGYDALSRLSSASETPQGGGSGWAQSYDYDAFGNRWVTAGAGLGGHGNFVPTASSMFDSNNRLAASTGVSYQDGGAGSRSNPQRISVASAASQMRAPCARSSERRLGKPVIAFLTPRPRLADGPG